MRTLSWTSLVIDSKTHTQSLVLCLVNQWPFNRCWPPTRPGPKSSLKKKASNTVFKRYDWARVVQIFEAVFVRCISPRLLLQSRLFWANQAEWFCRCCCRCCCCYWPYVGRQCHEPRALPLATDTSAKLLLLFVCKWKVSEGNKCPDWVSICNWLAIQYSDKVTSPKAARKNIFQTGSTRAAPGYTPPH